MAKAPLSQTIILTEDGSAIPVTADNAATIPPVLPVYTVATTLAGSTLPSAQVVGEAAIYAARYPELAAARARLASLVAERDAIAAQITELEP